MVGSMLEMPQKHPMHLYDVCTVEMIDVEYILWHQSFTFQYYEVGELET